ncbi:E3 ubiquitin-protein ligase RKP isoform X2 [Asparagus officinalis]|uniref:E3 ubiquitin-protein ligase RKP isoform X2 n=1 Tax=Asparagus officinalis TaxID=4686 RepID=UPI00098E518C|nr:E3 ubiquitin-protein ligase RKP isoform X2 [Asparagus officinalis]
MESAGEARAHDGLRSNGFSSGLALILSDVDQKGKTQKSHFISCYEDIGHQTPERTLEYILDLPYKSVHQSSLQIGVNFVQDLLKKSVLRIKGTESDNIGRSGLLGTDDSRRSNIVVVDSSSVCGDIRVVGEPLLVESFAVFSSARFNACLWKGKWMYEVTLETSGVQQLGWATISCPFTDRKGVGDAENSYAFDGRRVSKWNIDQRAYGQSWAVGDVIGCCIDLNTNTISFYRNGVSLGVAFSGIRKMGPGVGYYPAISLSEGERCNLNFGSHPFRYPIVDFLPIQDPPCCMSHISYLLQCLSRLLEVQSVDRSDLGSFQKLRSLKRFAPLEELYYPLCRGICEELFTTIEANSRCIEYIAWGVVVPFLFEVFGLRAPHDFMNLDLIVNLFLQFPVSNLLFQHVILALSCNCRTAPLVLVECPYSGSYPYLALACQMFHHKEMMVLWWKSRFEYIMEGFLSLKSPNKQDLQMLMPSVWWPGSCEDIGSESNMMLVTTTLSAAVDKIEEMHREICRLVVHFIPPVTPPQLPGSVFRNFLQTFILKVRGADHKMSSSGLSSNTALVSLYTVILHFLSEGFPMDGISELGEGAGESAASAVGFLHRGGKRSFPVGLFLNGDPQRTWISRIGGSVNHLCKFHPIVDKELEDVQWDEGCMDDNDDAKVTHSTVQKPCCCSVSEMDTVRSSKANVRSSSRSLKGPSSSISERSANVAAECPTRTLSEEIEDKPSSSDRSEVDFEYYSLHHLGNAPLTSQLSSDILRKEELLDFMLLLYHLGVAPNFRQAFYYMSQQLQSISHLDDTDKQIREKSSSEQLKRLKDVRNAYREELVDCVRQCTWFRISLFSRWKQRGMYATCMWILELILVLSKEESIFLYIPEFYFESLVDCFHALRRSDPPFVSSAIFLKQGLTPFVTLIVKHFNDPRILSSDIKDLLLQSISVLVQYKDYMLAFENNNEAVNRMPKALLSAFDNRSWIPVTNILLRLCKGSGFCSSKHVEYSTSSRFQVLLREACSQDEELFSSFLNRLFNTLSWTMTEFSVSIREMQENYQVGELQQRKCGVVFDLSCNLARILEFCTHEIPQAFLLGPDMNLRRLTELIIFILNHIISVADAEFLDMSLRRPGHYQEKTNRTMILAPLVGIILNLMDASAISESKELNDIISIFASMDCPVTVHCGFQYLLGYNWGNLLRGDAAHAKLAQLEEFSKFLMNISRSGDSLIQSDDEEQDSCCCICYACNADAIFKPCHHKSCYGCITRHLLNSPRCFFCNTAVTEVVRVED